MRTLVEPCLFWKMADMLMNELRQERLNVGLCDESCYGGVSVTVAGEGEDKEIVSGTNVLLVIV